MCRYGFAHWSLFRDIVVGSSGVEDGILVLI